MAAMALSRGLLPCSAATRFAPRRSAAVKASNRVTMRRASGAKAPGMGMGTKTCRRARVVVAASAETAEPAPASSDNVLELAALYTSDLKMMGMTMPLVRRFVAGAKNDLKAGALGTNLPPLPSLRVRVSNCAIFTTLPRSSTARSSNRRGVVRLEGAGGVIWNAACELGFRAMTRYEPGGAFS